MAATPAPAAAPSHTAGLASLLSVLGTTQDPDAVVGALVRTWGRPGPPTHGLLFDCDDTGTLVLGRYGPPRQTAASLEVLSRPGSVLDRASRDDELTITADRRTAGGRRQDCHVCQPIPLAGAVVGAVVLAFPGDAALSRREVASLQDAAAAIGLWLGARRRRSAALPDSAAVGTLSARQVQVLTLLHAGRTTAAIATQLGQSISTVRNEQARLRRAFDVGDTASLLAKAHRAARYRIGVDRLMWGADYPHHEGTSPYSRQAQRLNFGGLPEDEVRAMLGGTATALYRFDAAKLQEAADRVGPILDDINVPGALEEVPEADRMWCPTFAAGAWEFADEVAV